MMNESIKDIVIEIEDSARVFNLNIIVFKNSNFERPIKCNSVKEILTCLQASEAHIALQKKSFFRSAKQASSKSVMWWHFMNGKLEATSQHLITGNNDSILSSVSLALSTTTRIL